MPNYSKYNVYQSSIDDFQSLVTQALLYGDTEDLFIVNKFAQNIDVDAGETEDIWIQGGTRSLPGAAETFNITSTDAADDFEGAGARLVRVSGLDANYDMIEEDVVMDGTSNVVTTNSYTNIHRMVVLLAGDSETNDGTITATGVTSSNVMATIPIAGGITQMSHYMVPRGYKAFLLNETFSVYRASGTGIRNGEITTVYKGPSSATLRWAKYGFSSATVDVHKAVPDPYPEKSLIWYEGSAAANNTAFTVEYRLLVMKQDGIKTT